LFAALFPKKITQLFAELVAHLDRVRSPSSRIWDIYLYTLVGSRNHGQKAMKNKQTVLFAVLAVAIGILSNCTTPPTQPDPVVTSMQRCMEAIDRMPDGPAKYAAYEKLNQIVTQERQTQAMELSALAAEQAALSAEPTPYVAPTPIKVQIVPSPYGGY